MSRPNLLSLQEIIIILNNLQTVPTLHHKIDLLNKVTNLLICHCIHKVNPGKEEMLKEIYEVIGVGFSAALLELQESDPKKEEYLAVTKDLRDNFSKIKKMGYEYAFSQAKNIITGYLKKRTRKKGKKKR